MGEPEDEMAATGRPSTLVWFIATGGGPVNSTLFYVLYLYRQGFEFLHMGYASAMAVVLFILILALTIVVVRTSDKWVQYERI